MHKALWFAPFLLAAQVAAAQLKDAAADDLAATLLDRVRAENHPTCVMVGVVGAPSRVIAACNRDDGMAKLERDSVFELGTLSKVFAGLVLADMVQRGEVKLDDPAALYSPPGAKLPQRDGRQITLRHLVTHTASLPAMPPEVAPDEFLRRTLAGDGAPLYESLAKVELERPIGGDVVYSNLGFLWLSDALARRAGKRFDVLVEERVLRPLRMTSTRVKLTPELEKRRIDGHDRSYKPVPPLEFAPALSGATGWSSSMEDMLRLAEALAGRAPSPLDAAIAASLQPLHNLNPATSLGYAWILTQRPQGRVAFHNGQTRGTYTGIAVSAATGAAAVVVADAPAFFDDLVLHLVDSRTPLKKPLAVSPDAPTKPEESRSIR